MFSIINLNSLANMFSYIVEVGAAFIILFCLVKQFCLIFSFQQFQQLFNIVFNMMFNLLIGIIINKELLLISIYY